MSIANQMAPRILKVEKAVNNNSGININTMPLNHYQCSKQGYCFYNFNSIKEDVSNGFCIVNLNDIFSYDILDNYFNKNKTYISDIIIKKIDIINNITNFSNNNKFHIVYYLSIHNILNEDNIEFFDLYKKSLQNKCDNLYKIIGNFINKFNLLISYQYDKFYIRNKYYIEFINNYIKSNVKYISTSYDNNRYLIGRFHKIDFANIYKFQNNNFLACYQNNLKFININDKDYDIQMNTTLPAFLKGTILGVNSSIDNKSFNRFRSNYTELINKMNSKRDDFVERLKENLYACQDKLEKHITNIIKKHNDYTILIGLNLDNVFDNTIVQNFFEILTNLKDNDELSNNKPIISKPNMISIQFPLMQIFSKKINLITINNINNLSEVFLEVINKKIIDNNYNILVNAGLTEEKFKQIINYLSKNNNTKINNIFINYNLNNDIRLSAAYNTYFTKFRETNQLFNDSKSKYKDNKKLYKNLKKYEAQIKNYNNKTIDNKNNNCCDCCNCRNKNKINSYEIKYLPYIKNVDDFLDKIEFNIF